VFYGWTATSSSDPSDWAWGPKEAELPPHPGPENYYNLLTSGFLAGHLYLPVRPAPELLALKNPDGEEGAGIRLQDASLYKGKYYLYYGPTPALTLFLPWKLLTGRGMPHSVAVLLYATTGYIFSCLLLFLLLRVADVKVPHSLKGILAAALGLGNVVPVLLRRPGAMYEVAIMAGYCFFMAGMYLLARCVTAADRRWWTLIVAGLCLGLTAGCRPHYGVVAVVMLAVYLAHVIWSRRARVAMQIREF